MRDYNVHGKDILATERDKGRNLERNRLATECAKLDPNAERAMAEEGMGEELDQAIEGLNEIIGA